MGYRRCWALPFAATSRQPKPGRLRSRVPSVVAGRAGVWRMARQPESPHDPDRYCEPAVSRGRPGIALLAHSGGPTAVMNASLLGVVEQARRHPEIGTLYGAVHGIRGILQQEFIDLFAQSDRTLSAVARTPSLGTSRLEVGEAELEAVPGHLSRARDPLLLLHRGEWIHGHGLATGGPRKRLRL